MLTDTFLKIIAKYNPDQSLANDFWLEIFTKYSDSKRHYHAISHLEGILIDLQFVRHLILDWETTLLAVYYHDIIYKATSSTNEEDSAKIAQIRLTEVRYPEEKITKCTNMILATKLHRQSKDSDINFLTDADLAILGKVPEDYQRYTENVRKEYSLYPDFLYNLGRKKVLQNFLKMNNIFKTNYFFKKYEKQARINILNELSNL